MFRLLAVRDMFDLVWWNVARECKFANKDTNDSQLPSFSCSFGTVLQGVYLSYIEAC